MLCDHPPACPPSCTHCLAYDRHTRSLCSRVPSTPGSKWCKEHEGLQAKLLKSYKRLTLAVESFDDQSLPPFVDAVLQEEDMSQLRSWSEAARLKWGQLQRVIVARAEHHQQFYAGGDSGHTLFVESLKTESERLERLMRALDRRAYALTLAKSEAEWILAAPTVNFICDEPSPNDAPLTPPPTPPLANQDLPSAPILNKNQRKKAQRKAARKNSTSSSPSSDLDLFLSPPCCPTAPDEIELHSRPTSQLSRLRGYLVPPPDLPSTITPAAWHKLVSTLFRYVILRTSALAPLALTASSADGGPLASVEEFLDLLEDRIDTRCGEEVEKLWQGMKFAKSAPGATKKGKSEETSGMLGVGVLGDAIADAFRGEESSGVYVELLGGRVFKEPSVEDLPGEGWDLFYQFISCSGCSLSITRSFTSLIRNRRLAILGAYPAWLCPSDTPAEHVFRLAGISLCASNMASCGKKVKRIEQKESGGRGRASKKKTVLVEEWERGWIYCKMPLDDEWSTSTLAALASLSDRFVVLARNASTLEVAHSPPSPTRMSSMCRTPGCSCCSKADLWLGRVRSGLSPAERKAANWTTSTFFPVESVLNSFSANSSPETRFGYRYDDVMDVLIMDNRSYAASSVNATTSGGEWSSFVDSVAGVVVQTGGCESLRDLLAKGRVEAREKGEMEEEKEAEDMDSKRVSLGRKGGVSYAAIDEKLRAREMFREQY